MAITADGKIATANRLVSSFSSERDHKHLYELRATADAVMCGARTVDLNRISLGPGGKKYRQLRLKRGLAENSLRIIVTGTGSLDPRAHIFTWRFSPIIILTTERAGATQLRALRAAADAVEVCGEKELDLQHALAWLRNQWNVRRLLCEGGGKLNDALLRTGLVHEMHLTICPLLFGGRDAPTIADGRGFARLQDSAQFRLRSNRRVGNEMFLVFDVKR